MKDNKEFEFTIEAGKTEKHYWQDIWRYRELFYILNCLYKEVKK